MIPSSPTLTHDFGFAGTIVQLDFEVNYKSFEPSWRSEVRIALDTDDDISADADLDMSKFGAPKSPGDFSASGSVGASSISSNGLVYLTVYESFADEANPDARFGAGSFVTVTYMAAVPEPSPMVLCGFGLLAGVLMLRIRKRRLVTH